MATIQQEVAERFAALDARQVTAPIEIGIGDYAFYPYRGFSDIVNREDYKKLSQPQLKMLIKIADDILAMQRPELFEAFVNDDGTLVIDKDQNHIEYSIDIEYNEAYSRVEEIHPQVTYPQTIKTKRVTDVFVRNDTAHEVGHHADFWINMEDRRKQLDYLHSGSTLLAWCEDLDIFLNPAGVANLVETVRKAEGYDASFLLEEGYLPNQVDRMLRAEFFAIAVEFYYGSKQTFRQRSPLLEAYMKHILDLDLEIQTLYIPFRDMEIRRKILRTAICQPAVKILGRQAGKYKTLRELYTKTTGVKAKKQVAEQIEKMVIDAMARLAANVRVKTKLSKRG